MPDLETLAARARDALELPPHPEGCDRAIERGPERDVDGPLGPLCSIGTCDEPAVRAAVAFWSSSEPPLWDQVCERHRCDACRARALAADVLELVGAIQAAAVEAGVPERGEAREILRAIGGAWHAAGVEQERCPPAHDWTEAEAAALGLSQRSRGGIIIPDSVIAAEVGKARRAAAKVRGAVAVARKAERERCARIAAAHDRGADTDEQVIAAIIALEILELAESEADAAAEALAAALDGPPADRSGIRGTPPFLEDPSDA